MFAPWWKFSTNTAMLALEAQSVIIVRLTSIALGRGTQAENSRMVTERRRSWRLRRPSRPADRHKRWSVGIASMFEQMVAG
jgi:hypothetical protein